jgi:hypothetical protein
VGRGLFTRAIRFDQPHPYHAGFGNQGFLYNEAGTLTLVWSSFDREYIALVGDSTSWALGSDQQRRLEDSLLPSPVGDRWLFLSNPPRCPECSAVIAAPIS